MRHAFAAALLATCVAGCATAYQPDSFSGGFSETKLAEDLYQVRFQGNGYTRSGRVDQLLLRRCAELTLEQGGRWFTTQSSESGSQTGGANGWVTSFPDGKAVVKILPDKQAAAIAMDAVTIMAETDKAAAGAISPAASVALHKIKAEPAP